MPVHTVAAVLRRQVHGAPLKRSMIIIMIICLWQRFLFLAHSLVLRRQLTMSSSAINGNCIASKVISFHYALTFNMVLN